LTDLRGQKASLITEVGHQSKINFIYNDVLANKNAFKFGFERPRNKNLVTSTSQFLPPIIEDGSNSLSGQ